MELTKRQVADATELAGRHWPRRQWWGGFTAPTPKETEPVTEKYPDEADVLAQERADKRENDRLEALLTPPRDPETERLMDEAEAAYQRRQNADPAAMVREMEVRAGFRDPDEAGITPGASSDEIRADAKRTGWDAAHRRAYLDAIERENLAKAASRTYGGRA